MDFYVRYFEKEEKQENDNPTIGLILCSDKNETMVKYTFFPLIQKFYKKCYFHIKIFIERNIILFIPIINKNIYKNWSNESDCAEMKSRKL